MLSRRARTAWSDAGIMMVMGGSPGTPGYASDPPWPICHAESSTSGRLWVGRQTTSAPGMPAIPNAGSSDATGARLVACPSQADHATTATGLLGNGQRANHEKTDPWRAG